jgi:uncharacterized protein (TIGR02466 family)
MSKILLKEPLVASIFPTTIMFSELERDFTKEELFCVEKHSKKTYKNHGNITSLNNYILNEPEFVNLKIIITKFVNEYLQKIYKPNNEISAYITQSWLSFTNKNEYHHKHWHPNSFISGTLYINADKNYDMICFHNENNSNFLIESTNFDIHNSSTWCFPVYTGCIIAFSSKTSHDVPKVNTDKTRISLSFNTFIKGIVGNKNGLTELNIV